MAVIQIVRFHTKEDVDPEEFRALNERFQREVVPTLPGLKRREATLSADGEWLLVLRYDSLENATKAGKADTSEVARAFMTNINMKTMSASFYELVNE